MSIEVHFSFCIYENNCSMFLTISHNNMDISTIPELHSSNSCHFRTILLSQIIFVFQTYGHCIYLRPLWVSSITSVIQVSERSHKNTWIINRSWIILHNFIYSVNNPAVINHMRWRQREMCKVAKVQYRKKQPAPCEFCGTLIRCDMYRHVARCHLYLAQLWRSPVSWCTIWKGTPQDLMDHVCGAHNVPGEVQNVSLETLFPPWTVTRQVYTDSLRSRHSGISNDVLLFSDIGLSLVHHYQVHKRGLPHVAFRRNYMLQLCALLPLPAVLPIKGGSPDPACSSVVESPDVVCASPRSSRCAISRRRPTRVMKTPVPITPRLTIQDPLSAAGAVVLDCRPQVLPGAMDVSGTDLAEMRSMSRAGVPTTVPPERGQSFGVGACWVWSVRS